MMAISAARKASVRACAPPSFLIRSWAFGEVRKSVTLLASDPITTPNTTTVTAQATSTRSCSRTARSQTPARAPRAGPGRSSRRPPPRSRRARSTKVTGTSATHSANGRTSTHQWSPAKARICWFHPMGDSQDNAEGPGSARSPTARSA